MGLVLPIEVKYQDEPYFLNYARIVRTKAGSLSGFSRISFAGINRKINYRGKK